MTSRIVRRATLAIASTVVVAAGLLATGGSAAAATYPSSSHSGAASAVRTAGDHHSDRHSHHGNRHHHSGDRHSTFDGRGSRLAPIDEGRRLWVVDQLRWADDHGDTLRGLEHHSSSHL
ncbi:hypothetical protein AB0L85_15245 [Streptomyces sp. NPDC052051]|uniref:hypothetical protein n=1 Tax=Streptomyces sp. NPDC052051 TaxID=3154649 RepID=UPI0034415222